MFILKDKETIAKAIERTKSGSPERVRQAVRRVHHHWQRLTRQSFSETQSLIWKYQQPNRFCPRLTRVSNTIHLQPRCSNSRSRTNNHASPRHRLSRRQSGSSPAAQSQKRKLRCGRVGVEI